ncbi:predicted protein [Postia placenta Mad-698-R]|nr:predicted protein [Postia placenta Mad-698-R]
MSYQQNSQLFAYLDDSQLYGLPPAFLYPSPPTPPNLLLSQLSYPRPAYEQSCQEWDQFLPTTGVPYPMYMPMASPPSVTSPGQFYGQPWMSEEMAHPQPYIDVAAFRPSSDPSKLFLNDNQWSSASDVSTYTAPLTSPTPSMTYASTASSCASTSSRSSPSTSPPMIFSENPHTGEDIFAYLEGTPNPALGLAHAPSTSTRGTVSPVPLPPTEPSGPSTRRYVMWNERLVVPNRRAMAASTSPLGSGTDHVPSLIPSDLPVGGQKEIKTENEDIVPSAVITGMMNGVFNNDHGRYIEAVDTHTTGNDIHVATTARPVSKQPRSSSSSVVTRTKTRSKTMSKQSEHLPMRATNTVKQATQQALRKQKRKAPDDAGADRPCAVKKAKCSSESTTGPKTYPCEFGCGQKSLIRYDTKRHMAHSCPWRPTRGRKPFPCSMCDKGYSRKDPLIRHVRNKHKCIEAEILHADSGGHNDH